MYRYLNTLKRHPGVPYATVLTLLGFMSGVTADTENWLLHGFTGAAIMSVFWIPVLITAWTDRHNRK